MTILYTFRKILRIFFYPSLGTIKSQSIVSQIEKKLLKYKIFFKVGNWECNYLVYPILQVIFGSKYEDPFLSGDQCPLHKEANYITSVFSIIQMI